MKNVTIKLETINDVKNFVSAVTTFECDFDIVADRYVVDAKSIMGIFSLDLSKPLDLHINTDDEKEISAVSKAISNRLVGLVLHKDCLEHLFGA